MHEYTLDPTNTTLETILPCVDVNDARNTLRSARRSINRLVNATNGQIATLNTQLASGGSTTVLPTVCLPYGGPPDYEQTPCLSGQVDPLVLSTVSCHVSFFRCLLWHLEDRVMKSTTRRQEVWSFEGASMLRVVCSCFVWVNRWSALCALCY